MTYQEMIEQSRIRLIIRHKAVFYTSLFYMFNIEFKEPTTAADGTLQAPPYGCIYPHAKRMELSTQFLDNADPAHIDFLVVHELKHYVLGHHWRAPSNVFTDKGNAVRWNIAGDLIINETSINEGFTPIPEGCYFKDFVEDGCTYIEVCNAISEKDPNATLPEPVEDYDPSSTTIESVYETLLTWQVPDDEELDQRVQGILSEALGEQSDLDAEGTLTPEQQKEAEQNHQEMVSDALVASKNAGEELTDPHISEFLGDLFKTKIPWQRMFRQAISLSGFQNSTYSRLSRRDANLSIRLPSSYSRKTGEISIYIDSSGSISQPLVNAITSEVNNLIRVAKPKKTHVWFWDTSMHNAGSHRGKLRNIQIMGGGGTSVSLPLKDIKKTQPRAAIIFTDGYVGTEHESFTAADFPNTQLVWLVPESGRHAFQPTYGTTLYCEEFDDVDSY